MMTDEDWCQEKLTNLQIKDLRTETLNEIKNKLIQSNDISTNFSSALLDCLEDSNNEQTLLACDILTMCMSTLSLEDSFASNNVIERSLNHSNANVQAFAIREINRMLKSSANDSIVKNVNIVILLIKCLQNEDSNVGTAAIEPLPKCLPNFIGLKSVKMNLEQCLEMNDVIRCRVYEIAVKMSLQSENLQQSVEFILKRALQDLENEDILLQSNVLEILSQLPVSQHGFAYLENNETFDRILKKIETIEENPMAKILIPSLMKFFGNIAVIHPAKIFNGYPKVINALFECLSSDDYTILPVSYDTLGHLGRSNDGKKHLNSVPQIKSALKTLSVFIRNLPTDMKVRLLSCLQNLFDVEGNISDNQITCITQNWYDYLSDSQENLNFVMAYCKNPFPDIKKAALGLLKAICTHKWGQEYLKNSGGFIEYLLDRKTDFDKYAIQEKYEVIKFLSTSTVFDAQTIVDLKRYVADGAFYKESITEVAIEGGD